MGATALYLAFATGLPQIVILLLFLGSLVPYVLWLRIEPYFNVRDATPAQAAAGPTACVRCSRPIEVDPALSRDVFEGMHWRCFHLEFEHPGDPDLPCTDPGCDVWRLQVYEQKLRELGADPREVVGRAIEERYATRDAQ